jgi:hypothetical protein
MQMQATSERQDARTTDLARRIRRAWILAVALVVGILALLRVVQWLDALTESQQLDYYEGIVYDNAARILRHEPLYQTIDRAPYSVAAYMPIYPAVAALARTAFGDGFGPGRGVSVVSGLIIACVVSRLTVLHTGKWKSGVFAAVLFLVLGFPGVIPWMAMYRVDTLGVAFAIASIAVLLHPRRPTRRIIIAAALASCAILTKQLLFGASIAGAIWLWQRDRRQCALFSGLVVTIVLLTCAVLEFSTGAFLANTVYANINPIRVDVMLTNGVIYAAFQTAVVIAATLYVLRYHRDTPYRDLLVLYWLASFVQLLAMAKLGAYHNYWIENAAISSTLATIGLWSAATTGKLRRPLSTLGPLVALTVGLVWAAPVVFVSELTAGEQLATVTDRNLAFERVEERVRGEAGDVLGEPYDAVVLAGRPVVMETVIFSILYEAGTWDPKPMVDRICSGGIRLLVLNSPIDVAAQFSPSGYNWWPRPVMHALRNAMKLEHVDAGRFFYVPREDSGASECA